MSVATEVPSPHAPARGHGPPAADRRGGVRSWLRWVFRPHLCFGGLAGALVLFWLSLTPSLLPRPWLFQGAVSGVTLAIGYGLGTAASVLTRRLVRREPPARAKRVAWLALGAVALVGSAVLLWQSGRWQDDLRALMGVEGQATFSPVGVVLVAAVVAAVVLVGARLVRSLTRFLVRQVDRVAPRPVSVPVGVVLAVLVVAGFAQGILWRGVVTALNEVSSVANGRTNPGTTRPTAPERSGSPASLVPWDSLGRQGREFVGRGPTVGDLEAFHDAGCCPVPIRLYAGLDSAGSAAERAALVVREMERTGAFDRGVIGVFTATGTGWINPRVSDAFEYIHRGDTAAVSMQYSFLPSWMSFLVDQTKAAEAGEELIGAVLRRVGTMPAGERPTVLLYGESLGSYGTESAFADVAEMRARTDGALLVGPTFSNPLWERLTAGRDPSSPQWLPVVDEPGVHFASSPADLAGVDRSGPGPRVVYLQNASDPITWWSLPLAYREPDWAGPPRPADRLPAFRWFPLVTFWQVAGDLADSLAVPAGHGHYFGANVVDGWLAVLEPDGWTADRTERLRAVVTGAGE